MVARTICSRRTGPIPSLGVTTASEMIFDWSTNYPAGGVWPEAGDRVKRGRGRAKLLVPGPFEVVLELVHEDVGVGGGDDQAIRRHVAAVDAPFRRPGRAAEPADHLHLGLRADDHRDRADLVRGLPERGGAFVEIGALGRAPGG